MAEARAELSLDDLGDVKEELYKARNKWYDVGLKLKVPIDTLDSIRSQYDDHGDQLCEMLKPWLKGAAKSNPEWKVLVEVLRSHLIGESKLADSLEEKYCKSETESSQAATCTTSVKSLLFDQLKTKLEHLQTIEFNKKEEGLKAGVVKATIRTYITQSLQSGVALEDIQERLQQLHMEDSLISGPICKWAQQLANEIHTELNVQSDEPGIGEPNHAQPQSKSQEESLFCKDSVYHASVCSLAVNVCTAGEYQKFFKKSPLVPGHTFQAVSISRSKQDRYLIAKQGDSTYYFAFQSEPKFNRWPKQFNSITEGIRFQTEKFPIRLIIELLTNRCHIILTGFSFGGLLACSVATQVWNTPYVHASILKESLACITFGQPHIPVPLLPETATLRPELASTIHSIYLKDDLVPRLSRFLNECCSFPAKNRDSQSSAVMKVQKHQKMPFQDPITSQLCMYLGELQETTSGPSVMAIKTVPASEEEPTVLSKLKAVLKDIIPNFVSRISSQHLPVCAISYLVSCNILTGLMWSKMTEAETHFSYLQAAEIDSLDSSVFSQHHSMATYCQNISWAYLEKSPAYTIPSIPKQPLEELNIVKPYVDVVEIHHHGTEMAVALEGSNLWFCYRVTVGGRSTNAPAPDISCNSIQFNISKDGNGLTVDNEGKEVKVSLENYFSSKPIKQDVPVYTKEFPVTSRQQQLARLTPSRLIELAYLCALLEQHPHGKFQPSSHKVMVIRQFLESVVRVVPIESIWFAIAYGKDEIALQCAKALQSSEVELPYSDLMYNGVRGATGRFTSGFSPKVISLMRSAAQHQIEQQFPDIVSAVPGLLYETLIYKSSKLLEVLLRCEDFPQIQGTSSVELDRLEAEYGISPVSSPEHKSMVAYLLHLRDVLVPQYRKTLQQGTVIIVSGVNIEQLYPIGHGNTREQEFMLQCPIDILRDGKKRLASLAKKSQVEQATALEPKQSKVKSMASLSNSLMLKTVNSISECDLAICIALLGGFMEQQKIEIPLVKSQRDRAEALKLSGTASVGVWALSSLNYSDIQPILARCHGNQLLVQIEKYVKAIFSEKSMTTEDDQYAAKLQFMVQGMEKVVTCNSQYISYSLERQLAELCDDHKIDISIPLTKLVGQWGALFKDNVLSLVATSHRPLIARWLKWALMVNNLREKLAEYTAVGVAGLVNSGKSKLVNTLFDIQIPYGTKETKRTTVPFMYNLDEVVKGLDVVDFPGVDDMDETIPDLADLLLTLAQIVIFVVDYRKIHTESAKVWLDKLGNVPLLVCLTFADKLYAEHMTEDGKHPDKEFMKFEIEAERSMILEKLGSVPSRTVRFFSFSQDKDSVLNDKDGRQTLKDVGIGTLLEVGDWLVDVFRNRFGQEELADGLHQFVHKQP